MQHVCLQHTYMQVASHIYMIAVICVGETLDLTMLTCLKYCEEGKHQSFFIIDEMAPKWKRIGRMLKFSTSDMETITSSCRDDTECCDKLLSQWLQGQNDVNERHPKTWENLLDVIRAARLAELADKLEKILSS